MRRPFNFLSSLLAGSFLLLIAGTLAAQKMPESDVVHVPAMRDGLCFANLFQSNMVVQRDKPIVVWGWAAPGEQVTVTFGGEQASTKANEERRWEISLPGKPANRTPQEMTLTGAKETLKLENILVGDVWVLGGQSNMEFELAKVENGELEIISANYPEIRILTVPYGIGPEIQRDFARLHQWSDWSGRHFRKGDWDVCTPEVARELSAIGYVFARRVHMASQVPIGVIDTSRGGTTVETWTPRQVIEGLSSPTAQAKLKSFVDGAAKWNAEEDLKQRIEQHENWIAQQTKAGKAIPDNRKSAPADLRPGPIGDTNFPGHCYAGMIGPLEGLSVKGAIFHQGYNNAFEGSVGAEMYRDLFPEMIKAWRAAFRDPALPFGIISLCTEGDPQTREDYCEKMFNGGIDIRAAHYSTFLNLYNAGDKSIGYASSYDLRRRWYHPQVKIPAGERIARWALATQYGFDGKVEWKPPMLVSMERSGNFILLTLDREVGDPEEGRIEGFSIAGADRRFHPADVAYFETKKDGNNRAEVDRKRLVLTSPMVPEPIHFRYGWGRNPLANLQAVGNKDLPFATQKSDDWRMEEVPAGILPTDVPLPLARKDSNLILNALREQDRARRLAEARKLLDSEKSSADSK